MRPTTTNPARRPGAATRMLIRGTCLLLPALLAACGRPLVLDSSIPEQVAEIGCVSRCKEVKGACDADARADYRQCEAGYADSFKDYRWCLASGSERCGYPWWSCAENLYGYCSNRYGECASACRRTNSNR